MSNLIQKTDCVGLDCTIDFFQKQLYSRLISIWGGIDWDCFPRVYKTRHVDEGGAVYYKPEYMDGLKEYNAETLFNDKVDVTSFFLKSDEVDFSEGQPSVDVSLIFSCDITKLYTSATQKPDEKMNQDIVVSTKHIGGDSWTLNSMETGVEDVYREFKKDGVNWSDTSHRYLVRLNFNVLYSNYC